MTTKKLINAKNLLVAFTMLSLTANASNGIPSHKMLTGGDNPLTVKYLGVDGDYLLFRVTINTQDMKYPVFKVDDANYGELYSQHCSRGPNVVETVKVENTGNQDLSFKVEEGKKRYSRSFNASTTTDEKTTVIPQELVAIR